MSDNTAMVVIAAIVIGFLVLLAYIERRPRYTNTQPKCQGISGFLWGHHFYKPPDVRADSPLEGVCRHCGYKP